MHHYQVDDDGIITWANLIIATGHNNLAMNRGVPRWPGTTSRATSSRGDAQPGRGRHPLLRPLPELLDARLGQMPLQLQLLGP